MSRVLTFTDFVLCMLLSPIIPLLRRVRRAGLARLPRTREMFVRHGVVPITDHYYDPLPAEMVLAAYDDSCLRDLRGIDINPAGQLDLLEKLNCAQELSGIATAKNRDEVVAGHLRGEFMFNNESYEAGDAEFLYQMVRHFRPARVVEIGCGNSTLITQRALTANGGASHVCIEPYEMAWLENTGIEVVRKPVQQVDAALFSALRENDVLFIDTSHIIRPDGDVLHIYQHLLPLLAPGVIVHIHDIFTPRPYPSVWVKDSLLFWNEQYLLEALLTGNGDWEVLAAVNWLKHEHFDKLSRVCPYLTPEHEPGAFWMRRAH